MRTADLQRLLSEARKNAHVNHAQRGALRTIIAGVKDLFRAQYKWYIPDKPLTEIP